VASAEQRERLAELPSPETAEDLLDWDAWIEAPPARPEGTLKVRLVYEGRDKPTPVEDPTQ
jgi:hypothetical protein